MSSLDADEDQRWVPTHVQVTVVRGRGLRAKGKHGTSDAYTVIQVGRERYSTCVAERTTAPEWKEECCFELLPGVLLPEEERDDGPPAAGGGGGEVVLTVMHRALIGDVFLGQAVIPLDKAFQDNICMKNEWFKLNSKSGKKQKERGEVQVTVQFTRNDLTASMFDLAMKDRRRSTFGKLKDRMRGRKRGVDDDEPSVVMAPSRVPRDRLPSDGGGEEDYEDDEGGEGRRSKMRSFFLRGKLRKSSDSRSSTSLASESSESSSRGGSLSPTAGISVVVSDLSGSPSNSELSADNSPDHTADISPKLSPLKCEFMDESGEITLAVPPLSVHVNGNHDNHEGRPAPSSSSLGPPLQKPLPLSTSLQNLSLPRVAVTTPRGGGPAGDGRRWSFDRAGEEERAAIAAAMEQAGSAARGEEEEEEESAGKGRSRRGESGHAQFPTEHRNRGGWTGSKDHSKPSPHPVKPLTPSLTLTPSAPLEERGGRSALEERGRSALEERGRSALASGLEKLKSTISPGRSSQLSEPQPARRKSLTEGAGSYYHLTHNELVALLLRREAESERQRAEFGRQATLLAKREAELRRLKPQVKDLEDYIDTLLVRIMEQTPTLLQVTRAKLK